MVSSSATLLDLERELSSGETLLWYGKPASGIRFRSSDFFLIPFSFLWAGFALFWETGVVTSGAPFFFILWGIPFVVIGAYITVGRFFVDAYIRSRTSYGLTNQRIVIVSGLINRQVKTLPLRALQEVTLEQRRDGSGTITFGSGHPFVEWYRGVAWPGVEQRLPPAFDMITDSKAVYDRIRQAQRLVEE